MPDLRRTTSRRALLVVILIAVIAVIYTLYPRGERTLDPGKLAQNNLFQALHALNTVQRKDAASTDVTRLFASHLSGLPFPELAQQMNQLGLSWPMTVPPEGSASTIFLAYGILKKIPDNRFGPNDRITLSFTVADDGQVKVTKASWTNAAAHS
jgi:hypothetical protein